MNTDEGFKFLSIFAKEVTNVMFLVINFNSRCTTTWLVPLNFTFSVPLQGGGGFIRVFHFSQSYINNQLWTAKWTFRGINVILPLCDYMLDVLQMSIYVMRDETKERAVFFERQNLTMFQPTAVQAQTASVLQKKASLFSDGFV